MHPNKKIQNPKNIQPQASPWLLCPSKSFPGKFYYFNGSTGETAWSLSDTDKNLKKGPIHRVTDKSHSYPEPFDPPIDDSTNTTNSFSSLNNTGNAFTQNAANVRPSPVFGQAVFPKYVPPDILIPKFVWALTPMYMPSQMPQKQMSNQITQTETGTMFVPLNSHFQALKRPNFQTFQFQTSTPSQPFNLRPMFGQASNCDPSKPKMKDVACQTVLRPERNRTQSESDSAPKSVLKKCRSVGNHVSTKDMESPLSPPSNSKVEGNDKLSELDKNDLRFKLVAKKKRIETVVSEKAEKSTDQSKPTKSQEGLQPGVFPKKRVTFDLEAPGPSHTSSEDGQITDQSPGSQAEGPQWYAAVDTDALLSGLQCIEEFVKSDTNCRLLVPYVVYSELESLSRGDNGAISARQVLRKLHGHENHIVVQSKPEYEMSPEDSVLQCCWEMLQDCHVILVTKNKNIRNKAKSINLQCYTLDDIKIDETDNGISPVPEIDLAKLKIVVNDTKKSIIVENDAKKSENLFMQSLKKLMVFLCKKLMASI